MKKMLNEEMLDHVNGGCYADESMTPVGNSGVDCVLKDSIPGDKFIGREAIEKALKEFYKDVKLEPVYANIVE